MANAGWEEEDLDEISRGSCLTKLALELGLELESWVNTTTSPLPETLRVTTSRKDRDWTISELEKMGAKPIAWMPNNSAWQMPFTRGKVPEGYSKRILTICIRHFHQNPKIHYVTIVITKGSIF